MRGTFRLIAIIVSIPWICVGLYLVIPSVGETVSSFMKRSGPSGTVSQGVIRYVDDRGMEVYVDSLEAVPEKFRPRVQAEFELKGITHGDYQFGTVAQKPTGFFAWLAGKKK